MRRELRSAKQILRARIQTWSDRKLTEVYAFNADGNMHVMCPCSCIVGVDSTPDGVALHVRCDEWHYLDAHFQNPNATDLELAFAALAYPRFHDHGRRQRVLSAILRAELRRRDRERRNHDIAHALIAEAQYAGVEIAQ